MTATPSPTGKWTQLLALGIGQITRVGGSSIFDPVSSARAANTLQRYLVNETRLGIPAIIHEECCSGYMALGGTVFPQMIGLASTFQPELAEKMTDAIRTQMRAVGAHQGLAPVLDVARDPRWGRLEETFGEDPTLVSQFGDGLCARLAGGEPERRRRDGHRQAFCRSQPVAGRHELRPGPYRQARTDGYLYRPLSRLPSGMPACIPS